MFRSFLENKNQLLKKAIVILFWIVVWYVLAFIVNNPILLVTPKDVVVRLMELVTETVFWRTVIGSMMRIGAGFVLGLAVGLLCAAVSFRFRMAEELMQPIMSVMKTIPVASFVVLFLIWWGSSALAVAISFLVVLPNIYISTLEGLKATERDLLEMAKVFRLNTARRFFYIYRPALRPFLSSAMKLALGMCWKSGVAAEIIGTPDYSIGGEIYMSKIYLDTAGVLAWTLMVVLLSLCFERLMLWLADAFFQWMPKLESRRGMQSVGMEERKLGNLVLENVSKSFGKQTVVENQSVVYEPGKAYYLNGPSGSGKTTLLRLLCGLEQPDSGSIRGDLKYSMVFQEDRLCENCSAIQNVALVTGEESKAAESLGYLLPIEALSKPCSQLSGGMKRRVALVRAMEAESDIVLLDEPFTGMDADTKHLAEEYIKEKQRGRILIIASHI